MPQETICRFWAEYDLEETSYEFCRAAKCKASCCGELGICDHPDLYEGLVSSCLNSTESDQS